jgi:hypothetical protein
MPEGGPADQTLVLASAAMRTPLDPAQMHVDRRQSLKPVDGAGWTTVIAAALSDIGIEAVEDGEATGFLKNVAIRRGTIRYRRDADPSNLLHEAGHLACLPPAFRPMADDALSVVYRRMGSAFNSRMEQTGNPDDPLIRAIIQCSDPEATAWAWAFGTRCGVPGDLIILDHEYDGDGDAIRAQLEARRYIGINGLRAAGMLNDVRSFPMLDKWMQDAT